MPPGRRPNHDARISDLLRQLKAALVARERELVEAHVTKHVDAIVGALHRGGAVVSEAVAAVKAAPAAAMASLKRVKRKGWSPAARKAAQKRMAAWWAAKRKGKGASAAKPAAAKARKTRGRPSAGRLRQIAAMKAFWAAKKKAKGAARSGGTSL